jgi:hypothetical protein
VFIYFFFQLTHMTMAGERVSFSKDDVFLYKLFQF